LVTNINIRVKIIIFADFDLFVVKRVGEKTPLERVNSGRYGSETVDTEVRRNLHETRDPAVTGNKKPHWSQLGCDNWW
jgi:hypothetical protein